MTISPPPRPRLLLLGTLAATTAFWAWSSGGGDTSAALAPGQPPTAVAGGTRSSQASAPPDELAPKSPRATKLSTLPPREPPSAYLPGRAMIRASGTTDPRQLAHRHGAVVHRVAGASGWLVLQAAPGSTTRDLLASLATDPSVEAAGPVGRIVGAGNDRRRGGGKGGGEAEPGEGDASSPDELSALQWHLQDVATPADVDLSGVVVAVLDSGAALHDGVVDGTRYARAESLAGVTLVAPHDFVDGDDAPLDEHQHGTHIASVLLGDGAIQGVAAGAALMPLRVLDADNSGDEVALMDALAWAVDHGADIVNMSLSFPPGYVPSAALQAALRDAHQAGLVLVGAAGNHGLSNVVTWPAASPIVIAVGAYSENDRSVDFATDYSNLGPAVDVMAPGGRLDTDANGDGYVDGILGETFAIGAPDDLGYWMMVGTSQAAAVVSGAAAHLLAAGVDPRDVRATLQAGATDWGARSTFDGRGAGGLDIGGSLAVHETEGPPESAAWSVAILPYLGTEVEDDTSVAEARFRLTLVDEDGQRSVRSQSIHGTIWTADGPQVVWCNADGRGSCTVRARTEDRYDPDGTERDLAWVLEVDSVIDRETGTTTRPEAAFFGSDALEVLLTAIDDKRALRGLPLVVHWPELDDSELGALAESFAMVNSGSGLATCPMGLVDVEQVTFDSRGAGPMQHRKTRVVAIDGTELASGPLGLSAMDIYAQVSETTDLGLGLSGSTVLLGSAEVVGTEGDHSQLDSQVSTGGWTTPSHYELVTQLVGSGAVDVGLVPEGDAVATGTTGVEIQP